MSQHQHLPPDLERGRSRFQACRAQRKAGGRIPQALWAIATWLAKAHGVSRTAAVLGLDYYRLKERAEVAASEPQSNGPAFPELTSPVLIVKQSRFELDNGAGATMRVHLPLTKATTRGVETMPKRQPNTKKPAPSREQPVPTAELRQALTRRKKAELVDVLVELAEADHEVLRQLTARFAVATAPDELGAATRRAIADATDFDERQINRNFDYDYEAYSEVKRNLGRLIGSGQLQQAMALALELMKQGSYQVEMSDEGLMTEDIEDCLKVVLEALKKCDLPAAEVIAWCSAMLENDRVHFIAREPLESLRNQLQRTARR